jgi:hypothetical protein
MKRTASGLLGLTLEQFWSTTPADYKDILEGYNLRHDVEMQMLAWQTALLINVHSKRKIKPSQLLGKKNQDELTNEQKLQQLKKHLDRVNNKGPVI